MNIKKLVLLLSLAAALATIVPANALGAVSIGEAKKLPPLTQVTIENAIVTADQNVVPGSLYVESSNRSAGIRVITNKKLDIGQSATFTGSMQCVDGEWQMIGATTSNIRTAKATTPLGMTGKAIGCDPAQILNYRSSNPAGLFVRIWGWVTAQFPAENVIYINDGSNYRDGLTNYAGIRVTLPPGINFAQFTGFISIEGICRVERFTLQNGGLVNGRAYPAGAVIFVPSVWAVIEGYEPPPPPNPGPADYDGIPTISWDPASFAGKSIVELQIIRDIAYEGAKPVKVLTDPAEFNFGYTKLQSLFGMPGDFITVNYHALSGNPSFDMTSLTNKVPVGVFGQTHTYNTRIIYRELVSMNPLMFQYWYSPLSAPITATAIDPVSYYDIIWPVYNPNCAPQEVFVDDLRDAMSSFQWNAKPGADIYKIRVEPVEPGKAGSWESPSPIYAIGPIVTLPTAQQLALANMLQSTASADAVMRWQVYCRHSSDTDQAWVKGADNLFSIGIMPPPGGGDNPPPPPGDGDIPPLPPDPGTITESDGIPSLTWDPTAFGSGSSVIETQVLKDVIYIGSEPVKVFTDASLWELGYTKLAGLFGYTGDIKTFTYHRLAETPSPDLGTIMTANIPMEAFGETHTYMMRVLCRVPINVGGSVTYQYGYSPLGAAVVATAIEPVKTTDIVSPQYDPTSTPPEVFLSDLQSGIMSFQWNVKPGANVYIIRVEPVVPGTAGTWNSSTIYPTGPVVTLPAAQQTALANMLQSSAAGGTAIRWRVYCRNESDTSKAWVKGEDNLFTIGLLPPPN